MSGSGTILRLPIVSERRDMIHHLLRKLRARDRKDVMPRVAFAGSTRRIQHRARNLRYQGRAQFRRECMRERRLPRALGTRYADEESSAMLRRHACPE